MDARQFAPEQIQEMLRQIGWGEAESVKQPPQISPQDAREFAKFEQFPSLITVLAGGVPPGNDRTKMSDQQKRWPRMVYQALRHPVTGKWATELERPMRYHFHDENMFNMKRQEYEQFAAACQRVVGSEREYDAAKLEGWRDSAAEALKFRQEEHDREGLEAAQRNYRDRNMSEAALAESAAAEAEHFGHLPEIPEKPIAKRRGRPPKVTPAES